MFSILKRKTLILLCTEQELREKKTNSRCNRCKLQFSLEDYHNLTERKQSPDTWQNEACEILTLTEKDVSSVSEFGSRDFFYTQSVLEHSLWQWGVCVCGGGGIFRAQTKARKMDLPSAGRNACKLSDTITRGAR